MTLHHSGTAMMSLLQAWLTHQSRGEVSMDPVRMQTHSLQSSNIYMLTSSYMPVSPQHSTMPRPSGFQILGSFQRIPAVVHMQGVLLPTAHHSGLCLVGRGRPQQGQLTRDPLSSYCVNQESQSRGQWLTQGRHLEQAFLVLCSTEHNAIFYYPRQERSFSTQPSTYNQAVNQTRHHLPSVPTCADNVMTTGHDTVYSTPTVSSRAAAECQRPDTVSASVHVGHQYTVPYVPSSDYQHGCFTRSEHTGVQSLETRTHQAEVTTANEILHSENQRDGITASNYYGRPTLRCADAGCWHHTVRPLGPNRHTQQSHQHYPPQQHTVRPLGPNRHTQQSRQHYPPQQHTVRLLGPNGHTQQSRQHHDILLPPSSLLFSARDQNNDNRGNDQSLPCVRTGRTGQNNILGSQVTGLTVDSGQRLANPICSDTHQSAVSHDRNDSILPSQPSQNISPLVQRQQTGAVLANSKNGPDDSTDRSKKDMFHREVMDRLYSKCTQHKSNSQGSQGTAHIQQPSSRSRSGTVNSQANSVVTRSDTERQNNSFCLCPGNAVSDTNAECSQGAASPPTERKSGADTVDAEETDHYDNTCKVCLKPISSHDPQFMYLCDKGNRHPEENNGLNANKTEPELTVFANRNHSANLRAGSSSWKKKHSCYLNAIKGKRGKKGCRVNKSHSWNKQLQMNDDQSTTVNHITTKNDMDQERRHKFQKMVQSLRNAFKESTVPPRERCDYSSEKEHTHEKDLSCINTASAQIYQSNISDQDIEMDQTEHRKIQTKNNLADGKKESSRNSIVDNAGGKNAHNVVVSLESISVTTQPSGGNHWKADDSYSYGTVKTDQHNLYSGKIDQIKISYCVKCRTVFKTHSLYDGHSCSAKLDIGKSDKNETNVNENRHTVGKKGDGEVMASCSRENWDLVDEGMMDSQKHAGENSNSNSGLPSIDDDVRKKEDTDRNDIETGVTGSKGVKQRRRKRILSPKPKQRGQSKVTRNLSDRKKNSKANCPPVRFPCDHCHQVFSSFGGFLFHRQTTHKEKRPKNSF